MNYNYDQSHQRQHQLNSDNRKKEVVFLIDSNRQNIDFHQLFPDAAKVTVIPCSYISAANHKLQQGLLGTPTDIVLHVGTNDMDTMAPESLADSLQRLAAAAKNKYKCKVHVSLLTPRKDEMSRTVLQTNNLLTTVIQQKAPGVKVVAHPGLSTKHLRDDRHLNRYRIDNDIMAGTQFFAADLHRSVYGVDPSDSILKASKRWNRAGGTEYRHR